MIVTTDNFFSQNKLFELLRLVKGDPKRAYKSPQHVYIMKCIKCGQQAQKNGRADMKCSRCQYSVVAVPDYDKNKVVFKLVKPTGNAAVRAKKNLESPPDIIIPETTQESDTEEQQEEYPQHQIIKENGEEFYTGPDSEDDEEEEDKSIPSAQKVKSFSETTKFLKSMLPNTSGNRIIENIQQAEKEAAEPISDDPFEVEYQRQQQPDDTEPITPKKGRKSKSATTKDDCEPEIITKEIKIIKLKRGSQFLDESSNTLYICE